MEELGENEEVKKRGRPTKSSESTQKALEVLVHIK